MSVVTTCSGIAQGVYAVKVRVAGEGVIAETLRNKGFDVMMPVVETRRQYTDRVKQSNRALFPGYVFVKLSDKELLPLISTRGVSYLVKTGRALEPLSGSDLAKIRLLCESMTDIEPCEYLAAGQMVQIESGPLAGLVGVLVQVEGRSRVVLSVNSIFQSVSVDVRDTKLNILSN